MTDDELRTLVRDAIARHLGGGREAASAPAAAGAARHEPPWREHPSFGRLLVTAGDDDGGPCLIEPAVRCNHCGYCQSFGH